MLQNPERLDREQPIEMTAENQGNYPNFKQNLAEKENFVISKISKSQHLIGRGRLTAARFQKLTNKALSKEIRIWKEKNSEKAVFSR